ncbi:hypothetical protein IMCC21224_14158 [Puniceibacterium sp. IMCC21224]|nr:hypothetical protein IMCC21224_14158 [Puniceibacterium sp. IMCC21224]
MEHGKTGELRTRGGLDDRHEPPVSADEPVLAGDPAEDGHVRYGASCGAICTHHLMRGRQWPRRLSGRLFRRR